MLKLVTSGLKAGLKQPYLDYAKRRRKTVRPLFLDYAVTWRCNARCVMCDTWRAGEDAPPELSLEDLDRILLRDREFLGEVHKVGLTGGEPFLRGDLVEMVRLLRRRLPGARVSVVSNGLMTRRILKALEEIRSFYPELIFSVSLDGLEGVHDRQRGIPGAFAKAMATIQGAVDLGLTVTSGMVISELNYDQIEAVAGLLGGMGVDFSCNLQERGANFHSDGRADDLTPDQRGEVVRALEGFGHHYLMDNVRLRLLGRPRTLPCYSGMTSYFMKPDGDLTICNLVGEPLGNLSQTPFAEIAGSEKAWRLREKYSTCTCDSQCEVKNSAAVAPWHVLGWLAGNPRKAAFIRHYAKKSGILPS